jgi:hypothetical protein
MEALLGSPSAKEGDILYQRKLQDSVHIPTVVFLSSQRVVRTPNVSLLVFDKAEDLMLW